MFQQNFEHYKIISKSRNIVPLSDPQCEKHLFVLWASSLLNGVMSFFYVCLIYLVRHFTCFLFLIDNFIHREQLFSFCYHSSKITEYHRRDVHIHELWSEKLSLQPIFEEQNTQSRYVPGFIAMNEVRTFPDFVSEVNAHSFQSYRNVTIRK